MGAACTAPTDIREQVEANRQIEKTLKREQANELGNQKLLLLGETIRIRLLKAICRHRRMWQEHHSQANAVSVVADHSDV